MKRPLALAAALVACVPVCASAGRPPASAAGGIEQTLAQVREAYGTGWHRHGVLVQSGSERSSGLSGRWRLALDTATGRMHETVDYGVFRVAETWSDASHWRQDHSGGVHPLDSAFARANALTTTWLARSAFLKSGAEGARLVKLDSRRSGGRLYERLRATPPAGQPVEMWFDAATGLLARTIWIMPIDIMTIRYDDYRRVEGVPVPFAIMVQEGAGSAASIVVEQAGFLAPASAEEFAPPRTADDSMVAGGSASVPVSYDGDIVVEAMLNGQGPFAFILDTGGHDILTPEAATTLGLAAAGAGVSGGAGEGTLPEQYTRVARLEIGAATLRDQSFIIIPLPYDTVERGAQPPLAGILGVELFERFAVELDYRGGRLTLRPLAGAPPGHGVPVSISFSDDQPIITAKINGIPGDNGLDTGNSGALVVQGRWARRHGLATELRNGLLTAGFGAGGMSRNWARRVDLELAGRTFPRIVGHYSEDRRGAFASRTEAGNIGNVIFENFVLSFDYGRGIVWFDPVPGEPRAHPYPRAGMSVYKESPEAFTVATVLPQGPAAQAGIAPGDLITAVNGAPAATLSGWDFRRIECESEGTRLTLGITRGGQQGPAVVVLRELLP